MEKTLKQVTTAHGAAQLFGRRDALAELAALVEETWPFVLYIHGIPGIGKSALINVFFNALDSHDTTILPLDGEAIEPTFDSFLSALAIAANCASWTVAEGPSDDTVSARKTLISVDNYEHLLLLDDWLREQFVPSLPANMRLVLTSRLPPNMGWLTSPSSQSLIKVHELGVLNPEDVAEMFMKTSLSAFQLDRIMALAQGHPLTLVLAKAALQNANNTLGIHDELAKVLHELAQFFLKDIRSEALREALKFAAVARRLDKALLSHIFPRMNVADVYDQLGQLPFVEKRADGLKLHQVISGAILSTMESEDPDNVLQRRRTVWQYLRARDLNSGQLPTWRSTANMVYLLHNPVVREAFFPTGAPPRYIENARPDDLGDLLVIAENHDSAEMTRTVALWWKYLPSAFRIVRDETNQLVGFYVATDNRTVPRMLRRNDPLLDAWISNAEDETQGNERSLFVRRWLSSTLGEAPSPEQGASWIDLKRSYLEMRPDLRRVYVCAYDPSPYAPALTELQFQVLDDLQVKATNNPPTTAMLDFGPGSVDGWLSRLVAGDLNANGDLPFDFVRREIIGDGIPAAAMTKREIEVVRYLVERRGGAVSRDMLLDDVWGQHHHGGSNVVDVVVRSLRRKLGSRSDVIETVRGVGYRIN
jgi:hypothetical protein